MNSLVRQFFSVQEGGFQEVLFLEELPQARWEEVSKRAASLPRGWFELSRLVSADRIEFMRDFWMGQLPFYPRLHETVSDFFDRLEEVSLVLTRTHKEDRFQAECVYSLQENCSFFRGWAPASAQELTHLQEEVEFLLPQDYLSFLQIHNGFGQLSEMGLLHSESVIAARRHWIESCVDHSIHPTLQGREVDPASLIPFYESLELSTYQCFYADWYPGSEMGNVYLSTIDSTISDMTHLDTEEEGRSFPTFSDWLSTFLTGMSPE